MVLKVNVVSGFHLEALQRVLCLGNNDIALGHGISPFQIIGRYRGRQRSSPLSPAAIPCQEKLSDHYTALCQRSSYCSDLSSENYAAIILFALITQLLIVNFVIGNKIFINRKLSTEGKSFFMKHNLSPLDILLLFLTT